MDRKEETKRKEEEKRREGSYELPEGVGVYIRPKKPGVAQSIVKPIQYNTSE